MRANKNTKTQTRCHKKIRKFAVSLVFLFPSFLFCSYATNWCSDAFLLADLYEMQTRDIICSAPCASRLREKCLKCKHDNVVQFNEQQQHAKWVLNGCALVRECRAHCNSAPAESRYGVCVCLMGTFLCERIKMRHKRCNARRHCCTLGRTLQCGGGKLRARVRTRRYTCRVKMRHSSEFHYNCIAFANSHYYYGISSMWQRVDFQRN